MSDQIIVDQRGGPWCVVQNVADSAEFSTVFVGDKWVDNQQLVMYLVSQRGVTSMFKMLLS